MTNATNGNARRETKRRDDAYDTIDYERPFPLNVPLYVKVFEFFFA